MDLRRFSFFLFLVVVVVVVPVESQETENEREFSYIRNSTTGPDHWSDIHRAWAKCNHGPMQSPIDISNANVEMAYHLGKLQRSYKPAPAILINRGHDIMMRWGGDEGAGTVCINGTEYVLKQMHWHSPSEHSINGRRFAMELHMFHASSDNRFAVVSIVYKFGRPDSFLAGMEEPIHAIKNTTHGEEEVGIIDPRHVKRGIRKYYRYIGSLTTPPCTEPVFWTIFKKIRTVSKHQVGLLRDAVHDHSKRNARPIQATNQRSIKLYSPVLNKRG